MAGGFFVFLFVGAGAGFPDGCGACGVVYCGVLDILKILIDVM